MKLTKPIDYTGCNPEIAECLKRGEALLCYVSDDSDDWRARPEYVIGYKRKAQLYVYITELSHYKYVKPVKTKKVVKSIEKLMRHFGEIGANIDANGNVDCIYPDFRYLFSPEMFQCCGKEPDSNWVWCDEWLEEVEE